MGSEHAPGKTALQQTAQQHDQAPTMAPGKQPRQGAFMDQYTKGLVEAKPVPLKLNDKARARLELKFGLRVTSAQVAYNVALTDLKVERMIEKKEDLDIWTTLLIAAGGKVFEVAMMAALGALRVAGAAAKELAKEGIEHGKEVEGKILGLEESKVEAMVATGVDKGKEKTTEMTGEAAGEGKEEEKGAAMGFIEYLREKSGEVFQHIREDHLDASDETMLAAMVAFDTHRHTSAIYHRVLGELIELFLKSHAKEIGHKVESVGKIDGGVDARKTVRKETRVAWVLNGRARQLVYVAKEFERTDDEPGIVAQDRIAPGPAYDAPENALGLEEPGTWHDSGKDLGGGRHAPAGDVHMEHAPVNGDMLGPVEDELRDVALAAHEKRWLQAPQDIMKGPYGWVAVTK